MDDYNRSIKLAPNDRVALRRRALLWIDKEEFQYAIDDLSTVLTNAPTDESSLLHRGWSYLKLHQYDEAVADLERAIKLGPKDPRCLTILAWLLATCPDPKFRDGKRAVQLATASQRPAKDLQGAYLDILAAAHAENGDFEAAVRTQQEAIEVETDKTMLTGFRERLSLYKSKKPYRLPMD
jgi:Flp pilus assembly protein TadD